jgi:hypothetical protein
MSRIIRIISPIFRMAASREKKSVPSEDKIGKIRYLDNSRSCPVAQTPRLHAESHYFRIIVVHSPPVAGGTPTTFHTVQILWLQWL